MDKSKRLQLNREDLKKIVRHAAIIYGPVVLMFLDQIQSGEFDWKILWVLSLSVTIDFIRRLFTDYTKL